MKPDGFTRMFCTYVWLCILKMSKWILRKFTGKCELLRIINGSSQGAARTARIEQSCLSSKYPELKLIVQGENVVVEDAVQKAMEIKCIVPEVHPKFAPQFTMCVEQIVGYRELLASLEKIRLTRYNSEDPTHEEMLESLWKHLMPDRKREGGRHTAEWGEIGFQGHDPKTDFRGMGMLGLFDLLFFSSRCSDKARQVLSNSWHPKYGYSFAIVGINLTSLVLELFKEGRLKTHFYNLVKGKPDMAHYHQVYCYVFTEFDEFWRSEEPENVMDFNRIRDKFLVRLRKKLRSQSAILQRGFDTL